MNNLFTNHQYGMNWEDGIVVDLFAGGGGASTGLEMGLDRPVNIAVNHNPKAVSMHTANHPHTKHYTQDVYDVCPVKSTNGRPIYWFHMSPDCTHHSQAAGGQPRDKETRDLSWVGIKWVGKKKPKVFSLENVSQILKWGPLVAKRCSDTGRVVTLELIQCPKSGKKVNRIAAPGERVPLQNQYLVPCPKRKGKTWRKFKATLESMGYVVEYRVLVAADFGAPTTRERLYLVARSDGQPIVWPEPTHHNPKIEKKRKKLRGEKNRQFWRSTAECIDWSIPSYSIFLDKDEARKAGVKRPLADATLIRIAKGVIRYVLESGDPFIVPIAHYNGSVPVHNINDPLKTITAFPKGGSFSVLSPVLTKLRGNHAGQSVEEPCPTITSGGNAKRPAGAPHALALTGVYMAQMNGGFNTSPGRDVSDPMTTITNTGSQQQLVSADLIAANIVTMRNGMIGHGADEPLSTNVAKANHHVLISSFLASYYTDTSNRCRDARDPAATITTENRLGLVECVLSPEHEAGALRVAAFLMSYYGNGGDRSPDDPMATITTKDRLALVTVYIKGDPYVIVDIKLRMLQPSELYKAQGFPASYIISHGHDGKPFTKTEQVFFVGNSVSPLPMAAIANANNPFNRMNWEAA